MATEQTMEFPFDMSSDEAPQLEERVEVAKAELADEQGLSEPDLEPDVSGILNKYGNDPVKVARAFKAMQAELTRIKQGQQPITQPEGQTTTPQGQDQGQAQQAPQAGALTPEVIEQMTDALHDAAGGAAKFQAIGAWAKTHLDPARLQAYNDAVGNGKVSEALVHLKAMSYDFVQAQGFEGRLVGGRQPARAEVTGFASQGEMLNAMNDPRYAPDGPKFDEGYHRMVHAKVAASSF